MRKEICFAAVLVLFLSSSMAYAGNESVITSSVTSGGSITTGSAVSTDSSSTTTGSAVSTDSSNMTTDSAVTTKAPINLSLKDAVKIMQTTGTRAETAELNKKSDTALAKGYGETVKTIAKVLDGLDLLDKYNSMGYVSSSTLFDKSFDAEDAGATLVNKKISILRKNFALGQIDNNYQAEMNQIEYDTLKVYYGVLLAQDNLRTEQDNLKTQQDILKNTEAQYKVGMLAKKDVLSAESALTSAKSSALAAETKLEYAKMSFNYLLGYTAMQEVNFTDKLDVVTTPAINLDESIKNALTKRNEIKGVNFAVEVHQILMDSLKAYRSTSSVYMEEQIALLSAQKMEKDVPVQIEIDIRNKAAGLEDKKAALDAAKAMQTYAQEGYRLISISYDAGMCTLAELQQAQVSVYKTGLAVSSATSDYDLAYYDFKYSQDVGTDRLSL